MDDIPGAVADASDPARRRSDRWPSPPDWLDLFNYSSSFEVLAWVGRPVFWLVRAVIAVLSNW